MNWYIGQEIVAIRNHSQGLFKKGDEFIIKGIKYGTCSCKVVFLDIGIVGLNNSTLCVICGRDTVAGKEQGFHDFCFAPKEQAGDYSIEELLEEIEVVKEKELA